MAEDLVALFVVFELSVDHHSASQTETRCLGLQQKKLSRLTFFFVESPNFSTYDTIFGVICIFTRSSKKADEFL